MKFISLLLLLSLSGCIFASRAVSREEFHRKVSRMQGDIDRLNRCIKMLTNDDLSWEIGEECH